jgi:hypothetical protein
MIEDKFAEEMFDKMNHGVSRLSPISRKLYASLTFEFLSRGRDNTIKTSLLSFAKYLGITDGTIDDISKKIENAFDEIHMNTFVKYAFEIDVRLNIEESEIFISTIDNSAETTAIIERVFKGKKHLS